MKVKTVVGKTILAAIVAASLLATALPASANTIPLSTGGCTGSGTSYTSGFDTYASATQESPSCTWKYLDCYWQRTNYAVFHGCPGWTTQYSPGYQLASTRAVLSYHSLCAAGGPCGDSDMSKYTEAGVWVA
jgi:hypothetical protein